MVFVVACSSALALGALAVGPAGQQQERQQHNRGAERSDRPAGLRYAVLCYAIIYCRATEGQNMGIVSVTELLFLSVFWGVPIFCMLNFSCCESGIWSGSGYVDPFCQGITNSALDADFRSGLDPDQTLPRNSASDRIRIYNTKRI
jgi:hypothetical protein